MMKSHGGNKMLMWFSGILLLWVTSTCCMAVDRSKFRTCQQTAFCRRNRSTGDGSHSPHQALYRYKLLADTVNFSANNIEESQAVDEGGEVIAEKKAAGVDSGTSGQSENVWKMLQRTLLGGGSPSAATSTGSRGMIERVAGPPPLLTASLQNTVLGDVLQFSVMLLHDGTARIRVTETYASPSNPTTLLPRVTYDDLVLDRADQWRAMPQENVKLWWRNDATTTAALEEFLQKHGKLVGSAMDNFMALHYGSQVLLMQLEPFQVMLYRNDALVVELNGKDWMHFEVRRSKDQADRNLKEEDNKQEAAKREEEKKPEKEIVGYWEDGLAIYADGTREERKEVVEDEKPSDEADHRQLSETELDPEGLWEEQFSSHKDTKPFGPMSVGMDVRFPNSQHLYGIPEHASRAVLQTTRGPNAHYKEPYRLYNLDVFEYELDETMSLYGSIPFIVSHSAQSGSVGVFWFNPTETFVDVLQDPTATTTHWISESGVVDIFFLPGPDPSSIYRQYATLTGTTPLPPMFSLGYHQCRWNYKDEKDVYYVHGKFEELDYPYDVLWLDIEHTDGKRYFTWDKGLFPNPAEMQKTLAAKGRRMVTIVDPHIKRDKNYYIHKEAEAKGLYVKDKEGKNDFDGWCWPGSSSYLDFTAEHVRAWWADQFRYDKYQGSTPTLFIWNDMNEPSVFNGPEVSMSKDLKNLKGEEHREWHNLYGMLFHRATMEGLIKRNQPLENVRPFVLSRAFFAGSQRYGAIWTGDNAAEWGHLQVAAPMLLSMNAAALTFVGADVGGFFGNPDPELFTRWMQAGAYQPFFRGHAHHDSKRREPWLFDDATFQRLRRASMTRYALLPFWYTVFRHSEVTGMPVMRMMWMQYPDVADVYGVDDQYLIGSDLLVKPITGPGVTTTRVLFPGRDNWYDAETLTLVAAASLGATIQSLEVPATIDIIPAFQRGGSILPRKLRLRRSSMLMKHDPYTLYIALDQNQRAVGELYMDDEETFSYRGKQEYAHSTFTADLQQGTLRSSVTIGSGWIEFVDSLAMDRMIERIIIMGVTKAPSKIVLDHSKEEVEFTHVPASQLLILRKPDVSAMAEWGMTLS